MGYIAYRDKWDLLSSWWQLNYVLIDHPENWGNKWFPIWRSAYVSKWLSDKNIQLIVVITQKKQHLRTFRSTLPPKEAEKRWPVQVAVKSCQGNDFGEQIFLVGGARWGFFICLYDLLGKLLGNLVDKSNKIWSSWINVLWGQERRFEDIVLNVVQCGTFPTFCQYHCQNTEICGATTTASLFMLTKFWFINE